MDKNSVLKSKIKLKENKDLSCNDRDHVRILISGGLIIIVIDCLFLTNLIPREPKVPSVPSNAVFI